MKNTPDSSTQTSPTTLSELEVAQELAEREDYDRAYRIATKNLRDNPNDFKWMMVMMYTLLGAEKPEVAYHIGKRLVQMKPNNGGAWMNLGMAAKDIWQDAEALRCFKRGIRASNNNEQKSMLMVNASSVLVDTGRFKEAEDYALKALELRPESEKAIANLGFCQLAQRNWKEGWKNYRKCLGHDWRPIHQYDNEPQWDGKGKGTIVAYGEQGLGDQISFAQMLPDIKRWCDENDSKLIVDINPRLGNLFRRSFPDVKVYGTQNDARLKWDKEDQHVDYSLPIGQFAEYFRKEASQFTGESYLTPDPDRVLQWQSLFASKCKPVIGIAWSGGIPKTGAKFRRVDLERLLPVLASVDAHWVSLQYKDASKEIDAFKEKHPEIDIVQYRHGTLSNDYDDTVAMVAALDHVVAMHTTIIHVAGGLGVPCWTLIPQNSQWRYGTDVEDFVWANSVRLIRQQKRGEWDDVIDKTAGELGALFPRVRKGTAKTTRKGKLRRDRPKVRANGQSDHRQAGNQPSA